MKRAAPWKATFFFGGMLFLADLALVLAAMTPQTWSTLSIVIVAMIFSSFNLLGAFAIIQRWRARPQYVTKQGVSVWCAPTVKGALVPAEEVLNHILEFFVKTLPEEIERQTEMLLPLENSITENDLRNLLKGMHIHWFSSPITLIIRGQPKQRVAGAYTGKTLLVQMPPDGDIFKSALFHELIHAIDACIIHRAPDFNHTNLSWWSLARVIAAKARIRLSPEAQCSKNSLSGSKTVVVGGYVGSSDSRSRPS